MINTINFKLETGNITEQEFYRLIADDNGYEEANKNAPADMKISKAKYAKAFLAKEASEILKKAKEKDIQKTLKAQVDASLSVISVVEQ